MNAFFPRDLNGGQLLDAFLSPHDPQHGLVQPGTYRSRRSGSCFLMVTSALPARQKPSSSVMAVAVQCHVGARTADSVELTTLRGAPGLGPVAEAFPEIAHEGVHRQVDFLRILPERW